MAIYSPPSLTSPLARSRLGAAATPVTSTGLGNQYSVPGTSATGVRGGSNAANRSSYSGNRDPIALYQETLKKNIDKGKQFTNSVVRTYTQKKAAKFNAPAGAPVKNGRTTNAARTTQPTARTVKGKVGWGGYSNGNIPAGAMQTLSFARGAMLERNAANALEQLNAEYRKTFGRNIAVTDSYRSLGGQVRLKATKGRMAAQPGTSVHGYGKALDLGGGINNRGSAQNNWMQQNAGRFGFVNPQWAKTVKLEPWHWEFQR